MREAVAIVGSPSVEPGPIYGFRVVETAYGATISLTPGGVWAATTLVEISAPTEYPWTSVRLDAGNYAGKLVVHLADSRTDKIRTPAPYVPLQAFNSHTQAVRMCLVNDVGEVAGSIDGALRVVSGGSPARLLAFGAVTGETAVQSVVDVSRYASVSLEVSEPKIFGGIAPSIRFYLERVALDGGYRIERLEAGTADANGAEMVSCVAGPGLPAARVDHNQHSSSYCRRLHRARVAWDVVGSPTSASGTWWLLGW